MFEIETATHAEFGEKLPVLYRYIPTDYIDAFFRDGSLRLTTYDHCKGLEDPARRDTKDGKRNYLLAHGNMAMAGIQGVGRKSYLLCTSMRADVKHFDVRSYFKVADPLGFAVAVARSVPKFQNGRLGMCLYKDDTSLSGLSDRPLTPNLYEIIRTQDRHGIEKALNEMNQFHADLLDKALGAETYFVKAKVPFEEDAEFRFVFTCDEEVTGPIIVSCPDAIKFCTRAA